MSGGNKLSQFFFDGQARRRPGTNLTVFQPSSLEETIKKNQREREQRMLVRKHTAAAVKIQSAYRSFRIRQKIRKEHREVFDSEMQRSLHRQRMNNADPIRIDLSFVKMQCSRLCFFYSPKLDSERLIWLCQQFLAFPHAGFSAPTVFDHVGPVNIRRFLGNCLQCIKFLAPNTQVGFGPPLRTIEVYGFLDNISVTYLLNSGYFDILRVLLECRVQRSDVEMAPSPLAQSLVDSMFVPVRLPNTEGTDIGRLILLRMCQALFSPPASSQVVSLVLPASASSIHRGHMHIGSLVNVLLDCAQEPTDETSIAQIRSSKTAPLADRIWISPFLAYTILYFCQKSSIEFFPESMREEMLLCLSKILPTLLQLVPAPEDSDEDGETSFPVVQQFENWPHSIQVKQPARSRSQKAFLLVKCADLLCNASLVDGVFVHAAQTEISEDKVRALAEICHVTGKLKPYTADGRQSLLLHSLSFKGGFLKQLWHLILECKREAFFGERKRLLDELQKGLFLSKEERMAFVPLISLFCALFRNMLMAVHDDEFYEHDKPLTSLVPFSVVELRYICVSIRNLAVGLIDLAFPDARPDVGENYKEAMSRMDTDYDKQARDGYDWAGLFDVVVKLLVLLHERDARLLFCGRNFWSCHSHFTVNQNMFRSSRRGLAQMYRSMGESYEESERVALSATELRNLSILRQIPFVVPFDTRVQILQELIVSDKIENGRGNDGWGGFNPDSIHLRVRRTHLYEDALDRLSLENEPNLKRPIRVQMTNWAGLDEAGIDGGGIFREFLAKLLQDGFDPGRGLFTSTPHEGLLYPNPMALVAYPDDYQRHYYFLGRILGKLIYEHQLVELRFASFFLVKLLGRSAENVDIHHLMSFDPILYKNLLFLKTFNGDVRTLELDFSVVVDELGVLKKVDLKRGGRNVIVDDENKIEYLHLMADFYLNRQIRLQTRAFLNGLSELIDLDWLGMFDHREMQILISGVDVEMDLDDMRAHTTYSGGYTADHDVILWFWEVLEGFDAEQKRKLLKFITSCSRPPLLGFKDLYPPINVHLVPETDRLPTAATCMNMLKLPQCREKKVLKEKLLYAIESGEGFELS